MTKSAQLSANLVSEEYFSQFNKMIKTAVWKARQFSLWWRLTRIERRALFYRGFGMSGGRERPSTELEEIYQIFFIEKIDDENRNKLEAEFSCRETAVKVAVFCGDQGVKRAKRFYRLGFSFCARAKGQFNRAAS